MLRNCRLVARCSAAEKTLLTEVAQAMRCTPSDALRILVMEKAEKLGLVISHDVSQELDSEQSGQLGLFEVIG